MRSPIRPRTIAVCLILGVLSVAASAFLIAYWPRTNYPNHARLDRDRHPEDGEGRGFIALSYVSGVGYERASGWVSQQETSGGYNYASTTGVMPWPQSMGRQVAPWLIGDEPWPPDRVSRHLLLLRIGWPFSMLEGGWSQTMRPPRPPARFA